VIQITIHYTRRWIDDEHLAVGIQDCGSCELCCLAGVTGGGKRALARPPGSQKQRTALMSTATDAFQQ
jgi:hypothetical protein